MAHLERAARSLPRPLVLSLLVPGLGQATEKRYLPAAGFFLGTVLLAVLGYLSPYPAGPIALALPLWWMNLFDASERWF